MSTKQIVYTSAPSVSITGLLGVLFVALKLCGVISWPWIWVTCPFWIHLAIFLGIAGIALMIFALWFMISLTATFFRKDKYNKYNKYRKF